MEIPEVGWGSKVKVPSVGGVGGGGGGEKDIFWNYIIQEKRPIRVVLKSGVLAPLRQE